MRIILSTILLAFALATGVSSEPLSLQEEVYRARDRVLPALVHIQPIITDYKTGELKKQAVVGSGVIFDAEGYVVTNYHVAGRAERIICTLADKEQVPATYIGGDPETDIAVIKLQLDNYHGTLAVAELGSSDSAQVGQYVLTMGSPLSLARSIAAGVISTKDRYFSSDYRLPSGERTGRYNLWIQTDAAINPGNSGGPLVDLSGRVIGINSRATFLANNLGFAIPIDIVKEVTAAIRANGSVSRSWIGVHAQALQELEGFFGTRPNNGVLLASIDPGSPAEYSHLKAGDVILKIDGESVSARFLEELPAFYHRIASHEPGSEVALTVLRGEEEYTFQIVTRGLGEMQGEDFEATEWGFAVKAITRFMQLDRQLDDTVGVLVSGVKRVGPADSGGLGSGDVIRSINKQPVNHLGEFTTRYLELSAAKAQKVLLTVGRNGAVRLVVIKIDDTPSSESEGKNE